MARRVIGLDLGAYSVKLVRLEVGKQTPKFEIVTVVEEVLPHDPEEGEPKELHEKQRDAVRRLSEQGFLESEAYAMGLDAHEGQMRNLRVPPLDNRKIEAVLPGLLETEVPFDVDGMIVSWHRIETSVTEPAPEAPADGVDIRIGFGKKPAIARVLHAVQPVSIDPRIVHLSSAAPYELVRELGFQSFDRSNDGLVDPAINPLAAIIDFGHRATNVCIFDKNGIKTARSFLKGGQNLNDAIAEALHVTPQVAAELKHRKTDLLLEGGDDESRRVSTLATAHFDEIFNDIMRTFLVAKTSGIGEIATVAIIGGAAQTTNFLPYVENKFADLGILVVQPSSLLPASASSPATALALAYALSGLQVHAKDSRFNFRKDEFAWRGELDFMRSKSVPLILWGLTIICSLIILWSASSLVLEKENQYLEGRLKTACSQILGQKNVAPKKCLTMMKEQISSQIDFGIPEFTATDLYVKTAEALSKELNITVSELDVMEKKFRINAETSSFADVDKVVASLSAIPCLVKIERGRAQQVGNVVKFSVSSDIDCNVAKSALTTPVAEPAKEKEPEPKTKSKPKA